MMALFSQLIINDIEKDVAKNSRQAGAAWVQAVQEHPRVPVLTGALRRGIQLVTVTTRVPVKIRIASTTTNNGFDYPDHLNKKSEKHRGWFETVTGQSTTEKAVDALLDGV